MDKLDYIWTFNASALALNGSLSLEYHVLSSQLKVDPVRLVGSRLWLVLKNGDENFLYAMLSPTTLELYDEGRYEGDYLLSSEPFCSVRFLPRYESNDSWKFSPLSAEEGIRECIPEEAVIFRELIKQNQRVSFTPPSNAILSSVPRTKFTDLAYAVPDQLMLALRTVAYGDVSRVRSLPPSISAIGGVAVALLKLALPHLEELEIIGLIASLDLLNGLVEANLQPQSILQTLSSLPPMVDTFLEEIDPEKISPRTFVAGSSQTSLDWLSKTNDAEKAHEAMLKDIAVHLKTKGFKVYKSRSFDLFLEKDELRVLCEVKSANKFNTIAQGEKGVVQLLRYSTALSEEKLNETLYFLLLQDSGQRAAQEYLAKLSKRAGITCWLYDDKKEWPQRLLSLDAHTFPEL